MIARSSEVLTIQFPAMDKAKTFLANLIISSPEGSRLAGERELARDCGVARMTMRNAIDKLVQEKKLEKRPGSGTFMSRSVVSFEFHLHSFTEEMNRLGMEPSTKIISLKYLKADREKAHILEIQERSEILECTRLRLVDGVPLGVETVTIPSHFIPDITETELLGSLYELLKVKYGTQIVKAKTSISAKKPSYQIAKELEISKNFPCLHVNMIDMDQNSEIIMLADCHYRGDVYELQHYSNVRDAYKINTEESAS
jgi:GntR family transcriptional regulator